MIRKSSDTKGLASVSAGGLIGSEVDSDMSLSMEDTEEVRGAGGGGIGVWVASSDSIVVIGGEAINMCGFAVLALIAGMA